jgi:hypothetical protein
LSGLFTSSYAFPHEIKSKFLNILNTLCNSEDDRFYQANRTILGKPENARAETYDGAARERSTEGNLHAEGCSSFV